MISPSQFVEQSGDLTAVSFRFLSSLFNKINDLQAQVNTLKTRLDGTPGAPP